MFHDPAIHAAAAVAVFAIEAYLLRVFFVLLQVLMQHIRESLPELRERLQKRLQEAEAELAGYGDPLLEVKGNAGALLLHFFSKFARNFQVEYSFSASREFPAWGGG